MSETSPAATPPRDPLRNPSYPQRTHIKERPQWCALLQSWEDRITAAQAAAKATGPDADKLFAQMSGARDQIRDAVARLPMEVGDMYDEDKHKLEEAAASLERLFVRGKEQGILG